MPLVGDVTAFDRFGYPTAFIDRVALQQMLRDGRFAELTAAFEAAQARFETDWHYEYWAHDTVEAFKAEPTWQPLFDAWVAHSPTSFAPYAARGAWLCDLGLEARGGKLASETSAEQFDSMHTFHDRGVADLRHALQLRPRAISVSRVLIVLGTRSGSVIDTHAVMAAAAPTCPSCLHLRVAYMIELEPRWGGSHEEMDAFAVASMRAGNNERLAVLAGYTIYDRATESDDPREQLRLLDDAIAKGDASDFYRTRASVRTKLRDDGGALADLRKVVELRPAVALNHAALAVQLATQKDWREAERELRIAIALDDIGPVAGYRRQLVNAVRQQVADPRAPVELLDLALAFETDPERLSDLRRRREGWSSLVVTVDEPAEWREKPPTPSALALLLDDPDEQRRSAAWCRLLERAIRTSTSPSSTSTRFRGIRCELEQIVRARASDGRPVWLVTPRITSAMLPQKFIISSLGGLTSTSNATSTDEVIVLDGAGDEARKAIVSLQTSRAGPEMRTVMVQVQAIDFPAAPLFRVALGGPLVAGKDVDAATVFAATPLTWRLRNATKPGASTAIELVSRAKKPKVVATFTFDVATGLWRGPQGSKRAGFRRLTSDPRTSSDELDAWNRSFDPTATFKREPTRP